MVRGLSMFRVSSILMSFLFAISATFQLNDPDWYLWIPLYSSAAIVNLKPLKRLAKFTFWLGVALFIELVILDLCNGISAVWSMDMRERSVREKLGSGLVISSMCLHLRNSTHRQDQYGAAISVLGYGLSLVFFMFHKKEMKF